jgi:beta-glucosidase-like glycosyl hydrolase
MASGLARVAVAAFVGAAVLALLAVGADGAAPQHQAVDELALPRQVGQCSASMAHRLRSTCARLCAKAGRRARSSSRDNLTGPPQAKALVTQLRHGSQRPPLICVDQEGGRVRMLSWVGPTRSAPQQGAAGTERTDAAAAARALRATGINVVLAPVADVPTDPRAALASRARSRPTSRLRRSPSRNPFGAGAWEALRPP